jgi:hypothetical protein
LNPRHMDFQSIALPTELPVQIFHNLTSATMLSCEKFRIPLLFSGSQTFHTFLIKIPLDLSGTKKSFI